MRFNNSFLVHVQFPSYENICNSLLFNKITLPLGENSSKRNYFTDGKHSLDIFKTTLTNNHGQLDALPALFIYQKITSDIRQKFLPRRLVEFHGIICF